MGQFVTIGVDIAKSVFQVHGVDAEGIVVDVTSQVTITPESPLGVRSSPPSRQAVASGLDGLHQANSRIGP